MPKNSMRTLAPAWMRTSLKFFSLRRRARWMSASDRPLPTDEVPLPARTPPLLPPLYRPPGPSLGPPGLLPVGWWYWPLLLGEWPR